MHDGRSIALDVLRAIAVLLVLFAHIKVRKSIPHGLAVVIAPLTRAGWSGVDLFFVLSGFLVGGLLFAEYRKTHALDVKRFLVRRGFRIYPAFWFYTAVVIVLAVYFDHKLSARHIAAELCFVQNYFKGIWWGHTWSLAVEEHFYLLLPLLLFVILRRRRGADGDPFRPVIVVCAIVCAACLALRGIDVHRHKHYAQLGHIYATHHRLDGLMFGTMLAYLHHFHRARVDAFVARARVALVVAGVALVAPAFIFSLRHHAWMQVVGITMLYLGYGAILLVVTRAPSPAPMLARVLLPLAVIGQYSYSIYLWQRVVLQLAEQRLAHVFGHRPPFVVELPLLLFGCIALGVVAAKLVEAPTLRIRDRFFPPRSEPAREQEARNR